MLYSNFTINVINILHANWKNFRTPRPVGQASVGLLAMVESQGISIVTVVTRYGSPLILFLALRHFGQGERGFGRESKESTILAGLAITLLGKLIFYLSVM